MGPAASGRSAAGAGNGVRSFAAIVDPAPARALPSGRPGPVPGAGERSVDAVTLLRRIEPCFAAAGVTRIAEVTGLDRIGLPVALAVRPNARSLSVSQGKGRCRNAAMIGAAMEALELAAAEALPAGLRKASLTEIAASGLRTISLAQSTRCRLERIHRGDRLMWTEGTELGSGMPVQVPWSLVGIDYRPEPSGYHAGFQVSTDGLASGATEAEAVFHGLLELVERDASALLDFAPSEALAARRRSIGPEDADLMKLRRMIEAAGCRLAVIDMTTDIGLPAFTAIISDAANRDSANLSRYAHSGGCGCHPDPKRAVIKAIVEAAQSRITRITGSRDDLPPSLYQQAEGEERDGLVDLFALADAAEGEKRLALADAWSGDAILGTQLVLTQLAARGIQEVVAVPVPNAFGIAVVRVIVPGLQTELTGCRSKLGPRALSAMLGRLH
jgi:ribosomal protein S12 methylthiotransferase accessory factor